MFEQVFKNIDDALRKEDGCSTELDYIEQTSWVLFLKYLDDLEKEREGRAALEGRAYAPIIDAAHRWGVWAAPKKADGSIDHMRTKAGPDLIDYVNEKLFPYLKAFKERATGSDTIEYKIGEIFGEAGAHAIELEAGHRLDQLVTFHQAASLLLRRLSYRAQSATGSVLSLRASGVVMLRGTGG